jgi:hypothetical protein
MKFSCFRDTTCHFLMVFVTLTGGCDDNIYIYIMCMDDIKIKNSRKISSIQKKE